MPEPTPTTVAAGPRTKTAPPSFHRFHDAVGYVLVCIVALGEFVRYQFFFAWLPMLTNGDASQHVWWMHRWRDPELFPNDLLFDYFANPALSSPGHRGMCWLLAQVADPVVVGEWLALPMLLVCCLLIYGLGKICGGGRPLGGMAALLLFVVTGVGVEFTGGFARCHGLIILALVAIGWVKRDGWWIGGGLIYGALFYPPITALAGVITLMLIAVDAVADRSVAKVWRAWSRPSMVVIGGVIALGLLLYFKLNTLPAEMGPRVTAEQARQMPEFHELGRNVFWTNDPWMFFFLGRRTGMGASATSFFVSCFLVILTVLALPRAVPRGAWVLLVGSAVMWSLAHLLLFALYLPSRYLMYSLPLFMMMWGASALPRLLPAMRKHASLRRLEAASRRPWLVIPLVMVGGLLYGFYQLENGRAGIPSARHPAFIPGLPEALAAIESLPKDTLVAAHPYDGDFVPLLARRSVLANYEGSLAYHRGYYEQIKQRTVALFEAVYAADWAPIQRLADGYGVDVLLINTRRYTTAESHYFHPFDALSTELFARSSATGFAVFEEGRDRLLFDRGAVKLFWLGPMDQMPTMPEGSIAATPGVSG